MMQRVFCAFPALLGVALFLLPCPTRAQEIELAEKDEIVAVGRDVLVKEDEVIRNVVVVSGSITNRGTIRHDLVVVSGSATVEGKIRGSLIVVGGSVNLGPEADIKRDLIVVGGTVHAQPGSKVGHRQQIYSPDQRGFGWLWGWFTKGFLWARPLPPQLPWAWAVAGLFLLGYLFLAVVFPQPIQACVETLEKRPLGSFFFGLLVFVLLGPLVLLLVISAVGLVIIPFLGCALIVAFFFGKVAVYRYTGQQLGRQSGLAAVQQPLFALVVGTVLFCLLYTIPVVGFLVWGVVVPLGLGAATLAFFRSFRSESPATSAPLAAVAAGGGIPAGIAPGSAAPPPMLVTRVGFWSRLLATVLDFVLFITVFRLFRHHPTVFLTLWLAYHVAMWTWRGTTIGGIVLGIRMVKTDGRPLDFATALVRGLASVFSAMVLWLGFFWAGWDRDKQAWHDKIAGTVVVRGPRGI